MYFSFLHTNASYIMYIFYMSYYLILLFTFICLFSEQYLQNRLSLFSIKKDCNLLLFFIFQFVLCLGFYFVPFFHFSHCVPSLTNLIDFYGRLRLIFFKSCNCDSFAAHFSICYFVIRRSVLHLFLLR